MYWIRIGDQKFRDRGKSGNILCKGRLRGAITAIIVATISVM